VQSSRKCGEAAGDIRDWFQSRQSILGSAPPEDVGSWREAFLPPASGSGTGKPEFSRAKVAKKGLEPGGQELQGAAVNDVPNSGSPVLESAHEPDGGAGCD
jgi:hypothetical protein